MTGLDEPPAAFDLARQLVPLLGDEAEAIVRWDQRAQGEARADSPPAADPAQVARQVVESWVASLADDGVRLDVLDVTYRDGAVDVVVSGPAAPPAAPDLPDQVAQAVGESVVLNVRWIQSFDPGLDGEPPATRLDRLVRAWIGPRSSVRVLATSIDGSTVIVDLGADGRPLGLETLQRVALSAVQGAERVEIRMLPLTHIDVTPDPVDIPSPV